MLRFSRKVGESIQIGDDVTLHIVRLDGNRVAIGVDAPRSVSVLRSELLSRPKREVRGDDQSSQSDHTIHRDAS